MTSPPDIRRPFDKTLARLNGGSEVTASLNSRIILNERAVTAPALLSRDEQRVIADSIGSLPVDTAFCMAAGMERKHRIQGVFGLSVIFVALAIYVVRLWAHGYYT